MIAIIGAGGHAKCVYECLAMQRQQVMGFFDDEPGKKGQVLISELKVIDSVDKLNMYNNISGIFVAIGDNKLRLELYHKYKSKYIFPNAVHVKAYISEFAKMGKGNFIMGNGIINPGSRIGNYCIVNTGTTVGHDCVLEDGAQLGPGVNIAGGSKIGKGVFLGVGAKVGPGVTIGDWSVIGAGSVVLNDLPGNGFFCGCPAKEKNK